MAWWVYALRHFMNPFIDTKIYSGNINMMYATSSPFLSIISSPVNILFGPIAAYNFISVIAMPLSAYTSFILTYYLSKNYFSSIIGGFLFGFGAYVISENFVGDINLSSVYLIPLIAYVFILAVDKKITAKVYIVLSSILLSAQFLISDEIYATLTVMGFITIFIYYIFPWNKGTNK
jgi:hypothetical protein